MRGVNCGTMWARIRVFAFLTFSLMLGTAVAEKRPVEDLKASLEQKIVTLRTACTRSTLRFNPDGKLQRPCPHGIWTIDSGFQIERFKIERKRLSLSGKRIAFGWKGKEKQNFNINQPLTVEVDFPELPTYTSAAAAVNSIFVRNTEDQAANVPEFWAIYLRNLNKPPSAPPASSSAPEPNTGNAERVHVKEGVVAGHIIKKVQPVYPQLAKAWRIEGRVRLGALIGKDGKIKELHVVDPAGLGLEEEAARAVQKWEYQPYMLNGEPVEVETVVTVTYELRGVQVSATLGPPH
jgi:TonB family protein